MTVTTKTSGRLSLTRPPRDDDELYELVKTLWGVTIPRDKHCPQHQSPFSAFAMAFFAREPQLLVKGSRGLSGKSQMMSALGITKGVVWGGDTNIVGGSEQQSLNVLAHMKRMWQSSQAPEYMVRSNQMTSMSLHNESLIRTFTASQRSVRGPHPVNLLLDEIDEMDPEILESAKGQPMPQKNWMGVTLPQQTTMVSTLQYPDGTMMKEIKRFQEEELPIFEWCWKDTCYAKDGWLDEGFVEQKRREVSKERWRVEYDLGEPSIGNRAFDSDAVEATFAAIPPEPVKLERDFEQYEMEKARPDSDYVIAADWAQAVDYTVITVWNVTIQPIQLVYYMRMNRRPYPRMIAHFNALQKRYNAQGIHDATGLGRVVSDLIDGKVRNFVMAGRDRDNMLSEYVAGLENGKIRAPRIKSMYLEHLYASVDDLFSRAKEFHLPDSVCSAALAWKLVSHRFPPVDPVGLPKSDMNWMAQAVEHNTSPVHQAWQHHKVEGMVERTTEEVSFT